MIKKKLKKLKIKKTFRINKKNYKKLGKRNKNSMKDY